MIEIVKEYDIPSPQYIHIIFSLKVLYIIVYAVKLNLRHFINSQCHVCLSQPVIGP